MKTATMLLERGADVEAQAIAGMRPMHYACQNDHEPIVHLLISKGADANVSEEVKPPHQTRPTRVFPANLGTRVVVDDDDDAHLHPQSIDDAGNTPLHKACSRGILNLVLALINAGGDIKTRNANGQTPLHKACICGHTSIVRTLIERGADVNLQDKEGE